MEDEGKIEYVGNTLPEKYRSCDIIDIGNKAICPSFDETHQHKAAYSTFHAGLNVMDAESNLEMNWKLLIHM